MENAVDALYMGAAILILLVALAISISSFTNIKTQVEEITTFRTKTDLALDGEDYLNYIKTNNNGDATRVVSADTVIATIRRIKQEHYNVYLVINDTTYENYLGERTINIGFQDYSLRNDILVVDTSNSNTWLNQNIGAGKTIIKISLTGKMMQLLNDEIMGIVYNAIRNSTFDEYLGIYQDYNSVASANKITYRIITFVEK